MKFPNDASRVLGADQYIDQIHKGVTWLLESRKFLKFVSLDVLKMHSPALSVLRFLSKTFSELLKFTLQNTPLCG